MEGYRILAFDGGGVRAVVAATILERLKGLPFSDGDDLTSNADLVTGASAGAFIALAIAAKQGTKTIAELFSQARAARIFASPGWDPLRPKYSSAGLAEALHTIFPDDLRLRDLQQPVVIPAFRVSGSQNTSWGSVFFNNLPGSSTADVRVIDAALASSAAPGYFPSHNGFVDGGLVANSPCAAAMGFAAEWVGISRRRFVGLSIGTGSNPYQIRQNTAHWGFLQWIRNPSFSAPEPPYPLLDALFAGAVDADATLCRQILGERYFRINVDLGSTPAALDDPSAIPRLRALAEKLDLREASEFLSHHWQN